MKKLLVKLVLFLTVTLFVMTIELDAQPIEIKAFLYLEGCFEPLANEMHTKLNRQLNNPEYRGVLPGQETYNTHPAIQYTPPGQPYHFSPWNYNGTEADIDNPPWYFAPGSADPQYAVYHPDVVDWILVRFRTGNPFHTLTTIKAAAALLMKDGRVEFWEAPLNQSNLTASDSLYIQIDHRNHLGIMTPAPFVAPFADTLSFDFRFEESFVTGTSFGQKEITPDTFVMYAADGDQNADVQSYDINGFDNILWNSENGVSDYYNSTDFNMNADVNGEDKILFFRNNGIASRVPK